MSIIESYQKQICGQVVDISVKYNKNQDFPYCAIASYKSVLGRGNTKEKAKIKCEAALLIALQEDND